MHDVYVIGDGLVELAAALELAEVGLRVRIAPSAERATGDRPPQWDPDGEPDAEGALAGLMNHAAAPLAASGPEHAGARPVSVAPEPVRLRGTRGGWAPQPEPAALGVPAVPLSERTIAILGNAGATRAYLDRVKPVLTVGKTHRFGDLVRSRMGRAALERLAQPLVRERFGVPAAEVDVAIAAPGLNEALTRVGSLSGAVLSLSERIVARETRVRPAGGWAELEAVLRERLALYGAEFAEHPVIGLSRIADAAAAGPGEAVEADAAGGGTDAVTPGPAGVAGPDAAGPSEFPAGPAGLSGADAGAAAAAGEARWRIVEGAADRAPGSGAGAEGGLDVGPGAGAPIERLARAVVLAGAHDGSAVRDRIDVDVEPDAGLAGADAVETVELPGGGAWSLRLRTPEPGRLRARFSGPARRSDAAAGEDPGAGDARLAELLDAAGLRRRGHGAVVREVVTAPAATVAEREARDADLEHRRAADPLRLEVGPRLHGGELAPAVADARLAAVLLRRRLTGIAD
ncbi:hypothetical protein MUN78_00010 [Leucobacter allii]|uniref:Uncharacterized protein n=1 Tax=Leucobacter allii TaxID=2932247 RepID=A0ABY4FLX0_9MICO|nr:hypothetical protein [Leucobacter allii]UOQ57269.1 hypothetical protein MUN78_00010 [Leucobacter allii]